MSDFLPSLVKKIIRICGQIRDRRTLAPVLAVQVLPFRMKYAAQFLEAPDCAMHPILILQ